jgi:hypothetical protein
MVKSECVKSGFLDLTLALILMLNLASMVIEGLGNKPPRTRRTPKKKLCVLCGFTRRNEMEAGSAVILLNSVR